MKIYDNNTEILDVRVDDSSYRSRAIKGEHILVLDFSLPEYVALPVGAWCEYQNTRYTLLRPENMKMIHTRNYEYSVTFEAAQAELSRYKFRDLTDGRLKFSLTDRPKGHLQRLVGNLNARDETLTGQTDRWSIGECIDASAKAINYNHTDCMSALTMIADEFGTEWEIDGTVVSLRKVEYNRDNPLPLSYGKGNGFKSGVERRNSDESLPVEVLYVQGGSRNIVMEKYGAEFLHLPEGQTIRYDGTRFEDEEGFIEADAREYEVSSDGMEIHRSDSEFFSHAEDSLDCSEIYPCRDEEIYKVEELEGDRLPVIIKTPENLDYEDYRLDDMPTVVFQDGNLAGKEYELSKGGNGKDICEKYYENGSFIGWRIWIRIEDEDMALFGPEGVSLSVVGSRLRIFSIALPEEYVCDNAARSGAEWEMFREAVRYFHDHEDRKFSFTGELDGIWTKENWLNVGGKIRLGGYVAFTDPKFQPEPVLIRITAIKDYVNNPYSPEIELSNSVVGRSFTSEMDRIHGDEVLVEDRHRESLRYTKRRMRDTSEAIGMLEQAMLGSFNESITPLDVQTMLVLIGDESLQFRFVDSMENPHQVMHHVEYDRTAKVLKVPAGIIQHMTLDVSSVSPSHPVSDYHFWQLPAFETPILTETEKKYYLYAKVSRSARTGTFHMSGTAIGMMPEDDPDNYYLLMGLLGSEFDGYRSYVSLYGFTEILPGQINTGIIRDAEGRLVIDLANATVTAKDGAVIDGNIRIASGSSGLENLEEWENVKYLQQIFKAPVLASEGAILSELLAVKDDGGNVVAGLNASDSGKSTGTGGHGRLLFFAGADNVNSLSTSKTRIYEDGHIVSTSVDIEGKINASSGKIGGFSIGDFDLVNNEDSYSSRLSATAVQLRNNGTRNYTSAILLQTVTDGTSGRYNNYRVAVESEYNGSTVSGSNPQNIGLYLDVSGAKYENVLGTTYGNFAVRCINGMFSGLRPLTRLFSQKSGSLTSEDFFCLVWIEPNYHSTINLPSNPENGQTIFMIKDGGGSLTVNANKTIHRVGGYSEQYALGVGGEYSGIILFVYSSEDNKWWACVVNHL